MDADTKEEEEALAGHQVNPSGLDYTCLVWQPREPDSATAVTMGWEATRPPRHLDLRNAPVPKCDSSST